MGVVTNVRTKPVSWTVMVFDPNDRTTEYFPGDLFQDGVNVYASGVHAAKLAGRKTTYTVSATYSTAEGVDYSTLPPGIVTTNKRGAYNVAFQFTHNLQESKAQPEATWGFYYNLSNELKQSLKPLADFGNEAGIEAFYSWSMTRWLYLGVDV
jgi:porin